MIHYASLTHCAHMPRWLQQLSLQCSVETQLGHPVDQVTPLGRHSHSPLLILHCIWSTTTQELAMVYFSLRKCVCHPAHMHALQAVYTCMYMKVLSNLNLYQDMTSIHRNMIFMFLLSGTRPASKDLCFEILLHVHAYICIDLT